MNNTSKHLLKLNDLPPQDQHDGGWRIKATKKEFPVLKGMSFYKLHLNPNGIREPHWHANSTELGCVIQGEVLVTIFGPKNKRESFLVKEGEVFFIPSGSLHGIENKSLGHAELILQFSNEEPEDFGLSSTFGIFTDAVLGNTWGKKKSDFAVFKRSLSPTFASLSKEKDQISKEALYVSPNHYALNKASPLVNCKGGNVRVARQDAWPILQLQAMYALELTGVGMREPHWHPETAELGYVKEGQGRMSILSPDGTIDSYEMGEGDIYFIPKAYPHHIENLLETSLKICIFFDQAMPRDIGLTASVKSFSNNVLDSTLDVPCNFFESLPSFYEDLLIVTKINPVD